MNYAEVLLPLPLTGTFTYSIPPEMSAAVKPGHRVIVPFGRKKFYTGIVESLSPKGPEGYEVKPVTMTLDSYPIIRHPQLKLWNWVAEYYLCTTGEVYKAAVPAGLKVESETFLEINSDWEEAPDDRMSERETLVVQLLNHADKRMSLADIARETGFSNIGSIANRLLERGAIIISERLVEKYRSRKIQYVGLAATPGDNEALHRAFDAVKGAKKQETALLALLELTEFNRGGAREVTRAELMERSGVTAPVICAMAQKGIVTTYHKEVSRFSFNGLATHELPTLTEPQSTALDAIHRSWLEKDVTLLHGVTSSGKTEIYIHLIDYVLRQRRQALLLVPEIALTTQLTGRLQRVFSDKVVIYHSKFSDNERVDIWKKLLRSSEPCVVIGPRSAIFLPYANLGLVIVDEEHEPSYKQVDPAPRYNGRDTALVLARMHGAKALLGSATPAVDTYYKAVSGRYGLVSLTERYEGMQLPAMQLIDMTAAHKRKQVSGIFALDTRDIVSEAIGSGRQAIVFLNRRGYAPVARCSQCAWTPKCETCDVTLTYHKRLDRLVCHYCGAKYPMPKVCPACKEPAIEIHGYGTERIEDEVEKAFPDVRIARLDLDTTRSKDGYENIIDDFSRGKSRILVGTQMVTKGLDFAGVSAVAVVNADAMINFPDFRSGERAFNMIEQVAGRAGRRDIPGTVAIQTYNPSHPIFNYLLAHDYAGFFSAELEERRLFNYPPFTRIIYIYLKHRDERELDDITGHYAQRLRALLGTRVNGPDVPSVSRVQSLYIRRIMLKIEVNASMAKVKQALRALYEQMHAEFASMRRVILYYDVDPV